MTLPLDIASPVRDALDQGAPVVALESTVISHGLPAPVNLKVAHACERTVRDNGAMPATIGIIRGRIVVGCTASDLDHLANADHVAKVSRRDLAAVVATGADGATTVAGTILIAAAAGIRMMATGGIGGVHRGGEQSLDISADLDELARSPVAVVCAGAKSILDLPRTLEVLETKGVPVAGYGTAAFPAFFTRDSGLPLEIRVNTPAEAARLIATHLTLPAAGGVLIANPVPAAAALDPATVDAWIEQALAGAAAAGVAGKDVTPYLLREISTLSDGATLNANVALLENNATLAAQIACALSDL
jgi:pseudouridine-5'-phosphate glycosidase